MKGVWGWFDHPQDQAECTHSANKASKAHSTPYHTITGESNTRRPSGLRRPQSQYPANAIPEVGCAAPQLLQRREHDE